MIATNSTTLLRFSAEPLSCYDRLMASLCLSNSLQSMRIAFLTHYPELYGANRSLLDLIDGLRTYGVEACVIAPRDGDIASELRKRDMSFRACSFARWVSSAPEDNGTSQIVQSVSRRVRSSFAHVKQDARVLPDLVKYLRAWRTDVVYSNSSLLLSGALAARRLALPHVWHLREFGDLDYGYLPDLGRGLQKRLINRADAVIAVSGSIRNHYQLGIPSRMKVVYNGIAWEADFERHRKEAQRAVSRRDPYTFALIGVLHPGKGHETAIRAIHRLVQDRRKVKLILAGSGRSVYREKLEHLVCTLGLQSYVEFRGYTNDVFAVYRNSDAVLMCSTNEAMGRVTAEAMTACRPVIGNRSGGTQEIVEHEKTGLLYRGGSEALADCMERFMDNSTWASQLGENGWCRARGRFTIERYAACVFEILLSVAHGKSAIVTSTPDPRPVTNKSIGISVAALTEPTAKMCR